MLLMFVLFFEGGQKFIRFNDVNAISININQISLVICRCGLIGSRGNSGSPSSPGNCGSAILAALNSCPSLKGSIGVSAWSGCLHQCSACSIPGVVMSIQWRALSSGSSLRQATTIMPRG